MAKNQDVLTDEDIKNIKSYYSIDCDYIKENTHDVRLKCPKHGVRHRRLPDLETFAVLVEMYPMVTAAEWSRVYGTSREAVRVLYSQIDDESLSQKRFDLKYGTSIDWQKWENFFDLYATKTRIGKVHLMELCDISKNYFTYWMRKSTKLQEMMNDADVLRNYNKDNPKSKRCYRCSLEKPIDEFHNDRNNRDGKSATCKECNYKNVLIYNKKRQEEFDPRNVDSEKYCTGCETIKPRSSYDLCKSNKGGLQQYCKRCQANFDKRHWLRRKKFADAGLNGLHKCNTCDREREEIEFYLVRENPLSKVAFVSNDCRDCVTEGFDSIKAIKPNYSKQSFIAKYKNGMINWATLSDVIESEMGRYSS